MVSLLGQPGVGQSSKSLCDDGRFKVREAIIVSFMALSQGLTTINNLFLTISTIGKVKARFYVKK